MGGWFNILVRPGFIPCLDDDITFVLNVFTTLKYDLFSLVSFVTFIGAKGFHSLSGR